MVDGPDPREPPAAERTRLASERMMAWIRTAIR